MNNKLTSILILFILATACRSPHQREGFDNRFSQSLPPTAIKSSAINNLIKANKYLDKFDTVFTTIAFEREDSIVCLEIGYSFDYYLISEETKKEFIKLGYYHAEQILTAKDIYGYMVMEDDSTNRKNMVIVLRDNNTNNDLTHYIDTSYLSPIDSLRWNSKGVYDGGGYVQTYQILADSLLLIRTSIID